MFALFTLAASTDEARGFRLDRDERFVDPEDGWPGLVEIRLRRLAGGRCIGLVDFGGYLRCGVYAGRPDACRLYPVTWEDDERRSGPEAVLCPAPFAVTPSYVRRAEVDVANARRSWEAHEAAVAEWNGAVARARTIELALPFLFERVAAALETPLPEALLAVGTADERLAEALADRGILWSRPPRGRPEARAFAGLSGVASPAEPS